MTRTAATASAAAPSEASAEAANASGGSGSAPLGVTQACSNEKSNGWTLVITASARASDRVVSGTECSQRKR